MQNFEGEFSLVFFFFLLKLLSLTSHIASITFGSA